MTTCPECLKPCPEHGITFCATCHKHPGECDCGHCQKPIHTRFDFGHEIRGFCKNHATAPHWAIIRKGGVAIEKETTR